MRDFNKEAMAGLAAVQELHGQLMRHEAHVEVIRKEFKTICGDMGDIDHRKDVLQRQADEQQVIEARRARADVGVMAFAQRIEEHVDDAKTKVDNASAQLGLVSQSVERLIEQETISVERVSRFGCVASYLLASIRSLSDRVPGLDRSAEFSSGIEHKTEQARATAATAAPRVRGLRHIVGPPLPCPLGCRKIPKVRARALAQLKLPIAYFRRREGDELWARSMRRR